MDHLEIIEKSKEKAWMALEDAAEKNDYSAASIDLMYKSVKILKNGEEVIMNEVLREGDWGGDEEHEGGSYAGRKGTHYVRGHYSRDGGSYDGNSYRGGSRERERYYTRDDGKDHMKREMHRMMEQATTDKEREAYRRCIEMLDKD